MREVVLAYICDRLGRTHKCRAEALIAHLFADGIKRAARLWYISHAEFGQQDTALAINGTCASCGVKMVARTPARGGAGFWGCANFPRCRRTLPMAA